MDASVSQSQSVSFPAPVRFLAHLFSIVFHPLFITSYVIAFLVFIHPYAFVDNDRQLKIFRFITVFFANVFLPLFSIFLCWRLKFIKSLQLKTARERIIPYIIIMVFYWWPWIVYKNIPDTPAVAVSFLLGAFLAVCGGWIANIYYKISMHAIGAGGLMMFFILFSFHDNYASGLYLAIAVAISGVVCTSRLIVSDHTYFEIYSGLFVGLLSQYIAWQF